MKPVRGNHGHPGAEDAVMAAVEAMAAGATVAAKVVSEEAIKVREKPIGSEIGQGWIRTSEGVKPADLQSAPFGHFGTYPCCSGTFAAARFRMRTLIVYRY